MKYKKSVMFRFRHAFAFLTILLVVFIWGISAYAYDSSSDGTSNYTLATNDWRSYFGVETGTYPFLDRDIMIQYFTGSGFNSNTLTNHGIDSFMSENDLTTFYDALGNGSRYGVLVPDSFNFSGNTISFSENAYYLNAFSYVDSYGQFSNYRFEGSGNFGLVANSNYSHGFYVVSDAPFTYAFTSSYNRGNPVNYLWGSDVQETWSDTGLYVIALAEQPVKLGFTNMPVYISSSDGSSGFTTFTNGTTDFSFENENFNFNNLIIDNIIVDPNVPDPVEPLASQYYLNASLRTSYERDDDTLWCWSYWNFNNYIKLHPEQFNLKYDWSITLKTNDMSEAVQYNTSDFHDNLTTWMLGPTNSNSYFRYPLPLHSFTYGNFHLDSTLRNVVSDTIGTDYEYTYTYDVWGDLSSLNIKPVYKNTLEIFYITGTYYLIDDDGNMSGLYQDKYDFIDGSYNVLTNDVVNNYNPPPDDSEMLPDTITIGSDTPSNNYHGSVFNDGDVVLHVNTNDHPFTLSDVSYANLKNMFNDIEDFVDSTSENSFWTVLERTFSYIPAKIWEYLIISVAVICGFAVARYVVRR